MLERSDPARICCSNSQDPRQCKDAPLNLLVAHARVRNLRLATADDHVLDGLGSSERFAL